MLVIVVLFVTGYAVWWLTADRPPRNQLEADLQAAEDAIEVNPEDAIAREELGAVYMRAGRYDDALTAFEAGIKLAPDDAILLYDKGQALVALERTDEAIAVLEEAVELHRGLDPAFYLLATIYEDRGEWDTVLEYSKEASRLQPRDVDARFLYATALAKTGDFEQARAEYEVVGQMLPGYEGLEEALNALP